MNNSGTLLKPSSLKLVTALGVETPAGEASTPALRRGGVEALRASARDMSEDSDSYEQGDADISESYEDFIKNRTHRDHKADSLCEDAENCAACGVRDCPYKAIEHHWHDGCPVCVYEEKRKAATVGAGHGAPLLTPTNAVGV